MPKYEVTAPDGQVYEVDAPDGATEQQVLAYAQQNYRQGAPQTVQFHDGTLAEFPAGTLREVMRQAAQRYWEEQQGASQPTRLQQIEGALRKAHAAGNEDHARKLAAAYREERDRTSPYTEEQLFAKLERADAAGDTEAAHVIADEIRRMRGQGGSTPAPDWGNVRSGFGTTERGQPQKLSEVWQQGPAKRKLSDVQGAPASSNANDSSLGRLVSGKPQERTLLQAAGRELGLGGRAAIRGFYDLTTLVGGDAINSLESRIRGVPIRTQRENADWLSDKLGLPSPETKTERIANEVTSSLTGGFGILGLGRGMVAHGPGVVRGVGEALSAAPRTQLASMVGGSGASATVRENGGGPGAQLTAGLIGGLGPAGAATTAEMGLRGLVRGGEQGRRQMARSVSDFASVGATPSVGQATGGRTARGLESLLAGGPTSVGVMSRFAEGQADDIGRGLQGMANRLSKTAGSERAGRAIEQGVQTFAGNVNATSKALYWRADKMISPGTTLPMRHTQQALASLTTPNLAAPNTTGALINPKIRTLADNISADLASAQNAGGLPFETVRDIRSRIGEALSDFSLTTDKPTAEYKRLYAALSQDIEEAARQAGPDAQQALHRANTYFKASAERLDQLERVVNKAGGPEAVYKAAMSGTGDGATTLRAVLQSLPREGQEALTGAVVKRMGLGTASAQDAAGELFSAQTFLTNWNKLSPEAKRALFDRHGPKFAADMDKVARVASNLRQGNKFYANPSGTANRAAAIGYGIAVPGSLATAAMGGPMSPFVLAVLGGVTANVAARVMTNPRFVAWLARSTEIPLSALPAQIVALQGVAADDPDVQEVARALEQQAGNANYGRQY